MRIPITLVIPLCIALIAGIWWKKTKDFDFLTPPREEALEAIRQKVEHSIIKPPQTNDAITPGRDKTTVDTLPAPLPQEPVAPPKPAIDPGNLAEAPTLDSYANQAFKGPDYLIELASFLETEGHMLRASLAWERVLDSTKPDEAQTKAATNAMKRLRPNMAKWNEDPARSATIILQAGTGKKMVKKLKPILDQAAKDIEQASSGLLKVKTNITAGKSQTASDGPSPVAIWFSGTAKDGPTTEVLSFTAGDNEDLDQLTSQTLYSVLRSYFSRSSLTPPSATAEGEKLPEALVKRLSRLTWERLGNTLNLKPTTPP